LTENFVMNVEISSASAPLR